MFVDSLLASAGRSPKKTAVTDPMLSLSYGNLVRLADVMRRQVVKTTDNKHVGIMLPSTCMFAGTFYGVLWAGRVAVPLNFLLQPQELAAVVKDSGLDTVFTIRHFSEQVASLPAKVVFLEDLPIKREMVLQWVRRRPPAPKVVEDDLAVLLYTSGTSGVPKGVCQTYKNLLTDVEASIDHAGLRPDHRFLGVLPLFHSFALTATLLLPIALGASIDYIPRFHAGTVLSTIRERKTVVVIMIASMYTAILRGKRGGAEDLASIQYAMSGGEALPPAVFEQFKSRFDLEILEGYGMTEASPIVSLNVPRSNRPGTVGRAIPGVEVQTYDDSDKPLPPGDIGEIWIRGPIVMQGYYKKDRDSADVLTSDGWYRSGDMGRVDEDGYITITGRKKEMIIVGGENVYPMEIESVLCEHEAVAEAAAIGQPDASRGEVVIAFVSLAEGRRVTDIALRDYCRAHLAGYKVPRRVILSSELPRGPTGKILKRELHALREESSQGDA